MSLYKFGLHFLEFLLDFLELFVFFFLDVISGLEEHLHPEIQEQNGDDDIGKEW